MKLCSFVGPSISQSVGPSRVSRKTQNSEYLKIGMRIPKSPCWLKFYSTKEQNDIWPNQTSTLWGWALCIDSGSPASFIWIWSIQVANFRKTRHDNLVLFMGACMRPPHLAIVTSLCRGKTLHTLLHEPAHKEKFSMSKVIDLSLMYRQPGWIGTDGLNRGTRFEPGVRFTPSVAITPGRWIRLFHSWKIHFWCHGDKLYVDVHD